MIHDDNEVFDKGKNDAGKENKRHRVIHDIIAEQQAYSTNMPLEIVGQRTPITTVMKKMVVVLLEAKRILKTLLLLEETSRSNSTAPTLDY